MAIAGNIMVLKIFSRYKSLRSPANMLVINLAVSDLCLMLGLIPEASFNFLSGGTWQFGEIGCQIHAFCGAFFGYSQITTLTSKEILKIYFKNQLKDDAINFHLVISWDRYNVIVNGMKGAPLTYAKVTIYIILNWIWSFFWAITPIVGWGLYALDGMLGT